jgi:TalC/MipB family fructose-6-phosphate aldolase
MKLYIDSVEEKKIDECMDSGIVAGITTTPTFFVKHGVNPFDFYKKISNKYPTIDLQVELMGENHLEMSDNLKQYQDLGIKNLTFKTPISFNGVSFAAKNRDVDFNFHLVYSVTQAIFAATAGAKYVCPLLGRLDDNGYDGVEVYKSIKTALTLNHFNVKVMASSIRTLNHITRLFSCVEVDAITIPPDIFKKCLNNLLTDNGVEIFKKDLIKL